MIDLITRDDYLDEYEKICSIINKELLIIVSYYKEVIIDLLFLNIEWSFCEKDLLVFYLINTCRHRIDIAFIRSTVFLTEYRDLIATNFTTLRSAELKAIIRQYDKYRKYD